MRGSPIRGLGTVSPFKSSMILRSQRRELLQNSPDRLNSNLGDIEYWRVKAHQFESELIALSQEHVLNSRRVQRVDELQDKIEMLLRQNNHLVEQNETLLQVIQQKKIDNDSLRLQLDAGGVALERETRRASANINILDEEHKVHIDRLLAEITRLQDQIEEIEKLKKIEIDGIRSKYEAEAIQQIQNLRRSQQGNNELLELSIRTQKDTIVERNLEIERLKKEVKLEQERATGETSFLRNEIKKIEQQKLNEFELYRAEHENNINNLNRTNKKNEEEMKNLYENKIRRLGYEIEEKKNEIEENLSKIRRSGKESQQEIALLIEDKSQLRSELKDIDTLRLKQLEDLTNFYDNEIENLKINAEAKEGNSNKLLEDQVDRLRKIVEAKQAENSFLMNQIKVLKENEEIKTTNLQNQKDELEKKLKQMILNYEREIELLKIKTAKLYEADLQALRRQLENQLSLLASENGKLKESLKQSRDHLVAELEQKVLMRRDYETRLREMNLKYEREHQQLNELILMAEKNFQNAHSATSLRDIEHSAKTKKQHTTFEEKIAEKRNLQTQIVNKNKEIQALNLRIQKMQGYHEKQIDDLEKRYAEDTEKFKQSLNTQTSLLKAQVEHQEDLERKYKELLERLRLKQKEWEDKMNKKNKELDDKGIRIAQLEGKVQEMEKHHGILQSSVNVQKGNIEKTNIQMTALMNQEKDRLQGIRQADKEGIRKDYDNRMTQLKNEIADLNNLIENLRAAYEAEKVRSRSLEKELNDNLKRLDEKGILEEHVINIGLSNNYFKNVAEIFRKEL